MAVFWPEILIFDRVVSGDYPAIIDGTGEIWSLPVTGVLPDSFDKTGSISGGDSDPPPPLNPDGILWNQFGGLAWFNQVIITPNEIELGNLLTTQIRTIELFNSTPGDVDYTDFVNNVGAGVTILNQPSLPHTLGTFNSIVLNVQITTMGPPTIEGTLDFTVDGLLRQTALTGARVVMFPVRPEFPVTEVLEFMTDIIASKDGTEQRIRIRDCPRQRISMKFFEWDDEAANLRALLFEWLPRVWGVPIWWEERRLGADADVDDFTITVDTRYGDFREGGVAILFRDQFTFEALEIDTKTDSSLTFTSPLTNTYLARETTVLPVRFAYASANGPTERRLLQGQARVSMEFTTLDNVDLADDSAFSTYQGQILLDEPNLVRGSSLSDGWSQPVRKLDPIAGPPLQLARQDRSKLATRKTFYSATLQRLWEVRQLLHFLQGSVAPFYLPSFRPDLRVTATIGGGATTINIKNVGFNSYITQRQPFKHMRLVLNNGTIYVREITGSSVVDDDTEQLTVDSAFSGSPIMVAEIKRLEFLVLVRMRKDRVTLEHTIPGYASITMEVVTEKYDP